MTRNLSGLLLVISVRTVQLPSKLSVLGRGWCHFTFGVAADFGARIGLVTRVGIGRDIPGRPERIAGGMELTNAPTSVAIESVADTRDSAWHNCLAAMGDKLKVCEVRDLPAARVAAASIKPSSFRAAIAERIRC